MTNLKSNTDFVSGFKLKNVKYVKGQKSIDHAFIWLMANEIRVCLVVW